MIPRAPIDQSTLRCADMAFVLEPAASAARTVGALDMEQTLLYHEKQIAALCGVHCLNTLLQGPYFSEIELAQIGRELDVLEHQFMQEGGMHTAEYKQFQAEESGNVANDGMFSIQVCTAVPPSWIVGTRPHVPVFRCWQRRLKCGGWR
jgi:hypothetical protein